MSVLTDVLELAEHYGRQRKYGIQMSDTSSKRAVWITPEGKGTRSPIFAAWMTSLGEAQNKAQELARKYPTIRFRAKELS